MIKRGIFLTILITLLACNLSAIKKDSSKTFITDNQSMKGLELATFGNGCFWCSEAIFQQLKGVESVEPGFAGGTLKNPSYKEVCTGTTGHAEVIRLSFDPKVISYEELLEVFFSTHDPTTLNRQGADVGTQYRSVIFYYNEAQKKAAEKMIAALTDAQVYDNKIVTEITAVNNYYPAEDYHKDYYNNNKEQAYCMAVINPKLNKFMKAYKEKLKKK